MKTLITINSTIPFSGPAAPVLVFFDDGRWEIAHDGDVAHFSEPDPAFVGSAPILPLIDDWLSIIELPHLVNDGADTMLFLNQIIEVGRWNEPAIVLFANGDAEVTDRETAEDAFQNDEDFVNFVTIDDLVTELRSFVADYHAKDAE